MELIDKIEIVKGTARISITVNNMGVVILKHSKDVDKKSIQKFIDNKSAWIVKKRGEKLKSLDTYDSIVKYEELYIFEKKYTLMKAKRNKIEGNKISYSSVKYLLNSIEKLASKTLNKKIEYYKKLMNVKPVNVILDNSKSRWGVCTAKKEIKLNFRTVLLPVDLFEYVLVHELSHLIQFNHSPLFWKEVEKYCPNYKELKQEVKKYSFLLELYR